MKGGNFGTFLEGRVAGDWQSSMRHRGRQGW